MILGHLFKMPGLAPELAQRHKNDDIAMECMQRIGKELTAPIVAIQVVPNHPLDGGFAAIAVEGPRFGV